MLPDLRALELRRNGNFSILQRTKHSSDKLSRKQFTGHCVCLGQRVSSCALFEVLNIQYIIIFSKVQMKSVYVCTYTQTYVDVVTLYEFALS